MQLDLFEAFNESQFNFEKAKEKYKAAEQNYIEARRIRDNNCQHLETIQRSDYSPGGYYDTSYTETWEECKCCGIVSGRVRDSRNFYG